VPDRKCENVYAMWRAVHLRHLLVCAGLGSKKQGAAVLAIGQQSQSPQQGEQVQSGSATGRPAAACACVAGAAAGGGGSAAMCGHWCAAPRLFNRALCTYFIPIHGPFETLWWV